MRETDPQKWSALMVLAQDGDMDAYQSLLLGVTPYLRAIASRAHPNGSDVEDTVQDVLLTLHEVRQTYDPSRPFKPWLAGIARYRIADRLRILGRAVAREVPLDAEHESIAASAQSHDALDSRPVNAALRALPEGQRQAIMLLRLKERSLKEAAAESGMSIASLKVSVHRGIKALRRLLGEGGE